MIWFEWDNGPITIKSSLFESNRVAEINYEANPHGLLLSNCVVRFNDHGLFFYGSSNVTVEGCAVYGNGKKPDEWGNGGGQIRLVTDDRVVRQGDWGQKYLHQDYTKQDGDWLCALGGYIRVLGQTDDGTAAITAQMVILGADRRGRPPP